MTITTPYISHTRSQVTVPATWSWRVDDDLWSILAPIFRTVGLAQHRRLSAADDRRFVNGLIWLLRTGAQWETLPREFGPKSTLHARFQEWVGEGAFDRALTAVTEHYAHPTNLGVDEAAPRQAFRRLRAHWDREPANVKAFAQLATLLTIYRKARRVHLEHDERLAG